MLQNLRIMIRDLIWPAVISAGLSLLAVIVAVAYPDKGTLVLSLGLSAIAMACLAQTM